MDDKKIKLDIFERITLRNLLPSKGDMITVKIVRDLHNELSFSEEEIDKYEIKTESGSVFWKVFNDDGSILNNEKEISFGPKALEITKNHIEHNFYGLNKHNELTQQHLVLLEKFMSFEDFMNTVEEIDKEEKEKDEKMKNVIPINRNKKGNEDNN